MKTAISILQKVIVNHFYKVNAGLFLFLFFVLFGTPHNIPQFHLGIVKIIIQSPAFLLGVMGVWFLYNFKCMDYVIKQLRQPRQLFLYCLHNLSQRRRWFYLLFVQLMVYLPVLAYAVFVAVIAAKTGQFLCCIEIILFNAAVLCLTPFVYIKAVERTSFFKRPIAFPKVYFRLAKPLFSIPLYYIWHNRKQMLFVTKLFSLLLLYAFIKLYEPDYYDIRPLLLCFLLVAAANSIIVFEMKMFEDVFLQMQKNFPLTITRRFVTSLATQAVLLLPELIFVCKGYPLYFTITDYAQVVLLGVGLLSIFHACLLADDMNTDVYMKIIFAILTILFFVILYNPGILLELLLLAVSFGLYASYYYDFEKKYD